MTPGKRKPEEEAAGPEEAGPSTKKSRAASAHCDDRRVREVKGGKVGDGPVVYWMCRDQRVADNWALIYAAEQAKKGGKPLAVCYNVDPAFLDQGARQPVFMLRGLQEMPAKLSKLNIPFFLLQGDPVQEVSKLVKEVKAGLLVTDFMPMRESVAQRKDVAAQVACPVHEVDAHNIVPVWEASNKRETAARTIRPKIHKLLGTWLKEFPPLEPVAQWPGSLKAAPAIPWDEVIEDARERGKAVPEISWCKPGEDAAREALLGKGGFLTKERLSLYGSKRNDPTMPSAQSNLSPYLHSGQLAPQRAALEALPFKNSYKESVDSFLEELIIRRELSDNYVFYEPNYDNLEAAAGWAKETLEKHSADKREHLYTKAQLEAGKTADHLWNASQKQLVHLGKIHGFMRMYWAKKILEWTESPKDAVEISIYLNDKYSIDGRDPNGFVGCMWSVAGIHDQGWGERAIFGKIRYMNYNGCKRKFDINAYCAMVDREVEKVTRKAK